MADADRWREFVVRVGLMRLEQREYFATRSVDALHKAKDSERAVDLLLKDFDHKGNVKQTQATLFDTTDEYR